ncbi:MAG: hypothetical protein ACK5RE_10460 [Pseudanabaena sp.]|jgi:hypothetical protein
MLVTKKVGDLSLHEETTNLLGAKDYHHRLCISTRLSNGNATPKLHNAATSDQREQRGLSICGSRFFVRSLNIVAQMLNPYRSAVFLAIAYKRSRSSGSPLGTFANTFSNASQLTRLDFSAR